MRCLIGIDDTDSQFGRCTTHLGFQIVRALTRAGCAFDTYPRLVRLNPNIPFKTRGNAAVCIEFECDDPDGAFETARSLLMANSDVENGANSGLVFVEGTPHVFFGDLYAAAISGVVNHRKILAHLRREKIQHEILGNGMGVVGAAASIGFRKEDDHTYELIAYRTQRMCGTLRTVDRTSVIDMEKKTSPHTFNSYDHARGRILVTPHGPDPVFLGVRADSPEFTLLAFESIRYTEQLAGSIIYLSNQCTDAHLSRRLSPELKAYHSGWLEGHVRSVGRGEGGHVYLELGLATSRVRCAVYEPSGDLCKAAGMIAVGDTIRVSGGVRRATTKHGSVINVEKIEVLSLADELRQENPECKDCGTRMKSEGKDKGFQCRTCGAKKGNDARHLVRLPRALHLGIYLPSAGGQRHLTKQLVRYGSELSTPHSLVKGWLMADSAQTISV